MTAFAVIANRLPLHSLVSPAENRAELDARTDCEAVVE